MFPPYFFCLLLYLNFGDVSGQIVGLPFASSSFVGRESTFWRTHTKGRLDTVVVAAFEAVRPWERCGLS